MTCSPAHTAAQIRERGFRLTPQRMAILNTLHHAGKHLSPLEIFKEVNALLPGITEPTVYRTLNFLVENQFISVTHIGGGQLQYEAAQHEHHHLVCSACGRQLQISHEALDEFYRQIEQSTGYHLTTNHLTLFGLCPDCQSNSHQ